MKEELQKLYKNAIALLETMKFTYTSDDNKISQYGSFDVFIRKYTQIAMSVSKYVDISLLDIYNLEKIPNAFSLTWPQQKQMFDGVLANLSLLISLLENHLDIKQNKILELKDFLASNLRKTIIEIPRNEKEIQGKVETLLIGKGFSKGIDYDREVGRVKVSMKEVIPDFIFQKLGLALEIKFTKDKTKTKSIIDEINADIRAYGKEYANQLFLIYDIGTITDENEFKNDIDNQDNIQVIIVKH
ncbi:hypothetical protein D1164_14635 [Mariniphaga sediminis]|uniref:Uncharacterized protein n=1 Tax=Mariniphaga sediminis TaxID=1628158 RepID=A0A399CZH0_9BACT|nr:hypothetical protein [Mariniphaga sediminis]RIH64328.1 hypothetical protein D1164_14635 [Mariniphaga sediminis]